MTVTTDVVYKVWNDDGYGYEIGLDSDYGASIQVYYHEESFASPIRQQLTLSKEDAIAVANAIMKIAKDM